MLFARVIRLDESDTNVFDPAAEPGEWAIPGTFEFADWTEAELQGVAKVAFENSWLGLESFGRASVVAVADITEAEMTALTDRLAAHFVESYGAPDLDAARPVAQNEIDQMAAFCEGQPVNTLMILTRELDAAGVREKFRLVPPQGASIEAFAVHGD
ncbi:MAG: DUF6505 family protein [Paracoccaceae bacterium]|nr:DUF6505 family protein [Paracoccaceae bacterium]